MLWGVPRRVARRQQEVTELELVSIAAPLMVELILSPAFYAHEDFGRSDSGLQFACTAHEIRVNMCFKNVCDGDLSPSG